jgi:hypothetical protein
MARRKAPARGRTRTGSKGARKAAARKTAARKATARAGAARKRAAGRRTGRKATARKTTARTRTASRSAGRPAARAAATRKTAARKTTARKTAARKTAARKTAGRKTAARKAAAPSARKAATRRVTRSTSARAGAGRTASRSTATTGRTLRRGMPERPAAGAPSSLDFDRSASAFRSGRRELRERFDEHTETGPAITGGDVDADWESAYTVGDEAPGGDNPTPDQDIVDEIGRAIGVQYDDNEELKGDEKIARRDRHRWELDPASAEDYDER